MHKRQGTGTLLIDQAEKGIKIEKQLAKVIIAATFLNCHVPQCVDFSSSKMQDRDDYSDKDTRLKPYNVCIKKEDRGEKILASTIITWVIH
jgi:hypothetical protein